MLRTSLNRNLTFPFISLVVAGLTVVILSYGCSSSLIGDPGQNSAWNAANKPEGAAPSVAPLPTTAPTILGWAVISEKKTCEGLSPKECPGAYGFSVASDGTYTVGPAPG